MKESQNEQILAYLKSGNSLTPLQALELFNCWALSSRIADLNRPEKIIGAEMIKDERTGKRYAKYYYIGQMEMILK